jgi:flavin reductase (DIM6/NTAB) family NADH-FMN oxidoreductase RutF
MHCYGILKEDDSMNKKSLSLAKAYQLLEPGPVVLVTTARNGKANIMTMTWQTMIDFNPPIIGCIISDQNYSFNILKDTKECVLNIPTAALIDKVVGVGNTTGARVDKFSRFGFTEVPSACVNVPRIGECYAHIECKVIDMSMAATYNMFVLQGCKAWMTQSKRRQRMLHHCGNGVFVVDGEIIHTDSKKK